MKSRVQVTGLGVVSSAGEDVQECMRTMYAGNRNPQAPALFEVDIEKPSPVFEVTCDLPDADNSTITRSNRLLLKAVAEALNNAKLDVSRQREACIGVCLGTTVACTLNNESYYRSYRKGETPDFNSIESYLKNNPALFLSERLGCNGPVATIANACSSGTDAIGTALQWLIQGLCDVVIAGGTDELCRTTYLGFASLQVMSPQPCRPFDAERRGMNLGEGAGIVILEREEFAFKRGADALARMRGYGTYVDAYHPTAPHPEGVGLRKALDFAFKQAGLDPEAISFINAHGTSTINNDQVEGNVICDIFGKNIPVTSTKSYTGHTLGAAGSMEAAFAICSLLDAKMPGTAGFQNFDPQCGLEPARETVPVQKRAALSISLAFGGTNSVLLIEGVA